MPIALEDRSRKSAAQARKLITRHQDASNGFTALDGGSREAAARLTRLLISAPVDLAGISEEIRSYPNLEALVMRLTASLVLSPDEPLSTVEEAVVVLGTDRLRILIDLWSSAASFSGTAVLQSPSLNAPTPEMRYLASFLRCLGLDSPEKVISEARLEALASRISSDQMFALTDLFMRDFFSLLPVIQPGIPETLDTSRPNRPRSARIE